MCVEKYYSWEKMLGQPSTAKGCNPYERNDYERRILINGISDYKGGSNAIMQ
jgi:hypothetical protein